MCVCVCVCVCVCEREREMAMKVAIYQEGPGVSQQVSVLSAAWSRS